MKGWREGVGEGGDQFICPRLHAHHPEAEAEACIDTPETIILFFTKRFFNPIITRCSHEKYCHNIDYKQISKTHFVFVLLLFWLFFFGGRVKAQTTKVYYHLVFRA